MYKINKKPDMHLFKQKDNKESAVHGHCCCFVVLQAVFLQIIPIICIICAYKDDCDSETPYIVYQQ